MLPKCLGNSRGYTASNCKMWSQIWLVHPEGPALPICPAFQYSHQSHPHVCVTQRDGGALLPLVPSREVSVCSLCQPGCCPLSFPQQYNHAGHLGLMRKGDIAQWTATGHLACFCPHCPFLLHSFPLCSPFFSRQNLITTFGYMSLPSALTPSQALSSKQMQCFFKEKFC